MNKLMKLSVMCYQVLTWVCAITTMTTMIIAIIAIVCMVLGIL